MMSGQTDTRGACRAVRRHQAGGFLLELSLVLLVVGILTVATFEVHSAMRKRQQTTDAKSLLHSIDAAVRAFVLREHRLPCPAAQGNGVEEKTTQMLNGIQQVVCGDSVSEVPFISLGMEPPVLAGQTLRYRIAPALMTATPEGWAGLLQHTKLVSEAVANMDAPYVAGRGLQQRFVNCGAATLNPVYALMWMPSSQVSNASGVPALCFRESVDESMGLFAVSGQEFLGWLQANLRP